MCTSACSKRFCSCTLLPDGRAGRLDPQLKSIQHGLLLGFPLSPPSVCYAREISNVDNEECVVKKFRYIRIHYITTYEENGWNSSTKDES